MKEMLITGSGILTPVKLATHSLCLAMIKISVEHQDDSRGHHFYFWNETFFCTPPPFGEQALIGLQASCFKNPQQECFNTTLLEKLNSVKPVEIDPDVDVKTYDMN